MKIRSEFVTIAMLLLSTLSYAQPVKYLTLIVNLDVERYMGTWHEIAKFPNRFQAKCVSDTSAEYRLLTDGSIQVVNQCRLRNGAMEQALGAARRLGEDGSARLQVRFAPQWLSFLPWVWGDYWIIDLDDRYELAAVSEPRREYLWILSRTPTVPPERYNALLSRLALQGFDLAKLEASPQGAHP